MDRPAAQARLRALLAGGLLLTASTAQAHDSWLSPSADSSPQGLLRVELNIGSRFPLRQGSTPVSSVESAGCRPLADRSREVPLLPRVERTDRLELRSRLDARSALTCWVTLRPHAVTLAPELVATYLDEVRAPTRVRQIWEQQLARGLPWHEVYRKFMRMELNPRAAADQDLRSIRQPHGVGLELAVWGGDPLRVGQAATFQVLLEGKPLSGQPVEFVNERIGLGIWRETDAQGRVEFTFPFTGQWLLRATRIEPPEEKAQVWQSRFATLSVFLQ